MFSAIVGSESGDMFSFFGVFFVEHERLGVIAIGGTGGGQVPFKLSPAFLFTERLGVFFPSVLVLNGVDESGTTTNSSFSVHPRKTHK